MASANSTAKDTAASPPEQVGSRAGLVALLFGLAFVHGLALNLMGVLFPTIGETFGLDKAHQGLLQTFFTVGTLAALVIAGYLTNYIGAKRVTGAALAIGGGGAILFGLAPVYTLVLAGAFLLALGIAPLIVAYAAIISAKFADVRQRMYMWTFAVLAGSATVSTALVGGLIDMISYKVVFVALGVFIWGWAALLFAIAGGSLEPDVGKFHLGDDPDVTETIGIGQKIRSFARFLASGILTRSALYILGFIVVLDNLASGNQLAWMPSFFEETYGLSNIGMVLSAWTAGILVGRLALGAIPPGGVSDRTLLAVCYTGATVVFALILVLHPSSTVALLLVAINGAFTSAQAPTTYSIATARFRERTPAAIPLIDAIGNFGLIIGAPLLGFIADLTGELQAAMWVIPLAGMSLVVVVAVWQLYDRARGIVTESGIKSEEGPFG